MDRSIFSRVFYINLIALAFLLWSGSCVAVAARYHVDHDRVGRQDIQQESSPATSGDEAQFESSWDQARHFFYSGQYQQAIDLASASRETSSDEQWPLLKADCEMALGQYGRALKTLDDALERFPRSIRVRWMGVRVCRFNGDTQRANDLSAEIESLWTDRTWRYRSAENQIVLGRYYLSKRVDAKQVMNRYFDAARTRNPNLPDVYLALGELALEKHDYALAAENFSRAIELDAQNPDGHFGLALAYSPSDSDKATKSLETALKLNPHHAPSLLEKVDRMISGEYYAVAEETLKDILAINPDQPVAWAYRAVLAHLDNDPQGEGRARSKALSTWNGNPQIDHLIGKKLSQKYRFEDGSHYQRRSLVYDSHFLPAKIQLAHDLLRLGQELEGWKLADEVFDADQYSVVAHNLVTLRDELTRFRTLEQNGFVVRMAASEADIYGQRVLALLGDAQKLLADKYEVELETPIFIEIFPRQQDFAIRTFGLPGGAGFLGVCFGRVITMNSPAAQGANLTSWESVLWHEFCHVVTLQKTNNRMPRWLSEGISVYEENLRDPAWGEQMNSRYREMILGDDLSPVSELSGAFLRPPSAQHLQFAYFESALVVEFLVGEFGLPAMLKMLGDLSHGIPVNDALRRHMAPVDFLDREFATFARQKATEFAAAADWEKPDLTPDSDASDWTAWNEQHPNNIRGLLGLAVALQKDEKWNESIAPVQQAVQLSGDRSADAYRLLARAYRQLDNSVEEQAALENLTGLDVDSVDVWTRLLELASDAGEWQKTKRFAQRLLALNPLIAAPHRYLAMAAEETSDDESTIQALSALAKLGPLDPADVHYRLSGSLYRTGQLADAKRQVIMALEHAPRFRDAHRLLLKIVDELESSTESRPADANNAATGDRPETGRGANQSRSAQRETSK